MAKKTEVVTDVNVEEEKGPNDVQFSLNVETEPVNNLLHGVALEINHRPQIWAGFAAAALSGLGGHNVETNTKNAAAMADAMLAQWEARLPQWEATL